jgi:hypothetical protein
MFKNNLIFKASAAVFGMSSVLAYPISKSKTDLIYQKTEQNEKIVQMCRDHLR